MGRLRPLPRKCCPPRGRDSQPLPMCRSVFYKRFAPLAGRLYSEDLKESKNEGRSDDRTPFLCQIDGKVASRESVTDRGQEREATRYYAAS